MRCGLLSKCFDHLLLLGRIAVRVLAAVVWQAARTCSATEVRRQLHWLPVKQRINYKYKLAVLTYKARQSGSPSYLACLISDCLYAISFTEIVGQTAA